MMRTRQPPEKRRHIRQNPHALVDKSCAVPIRPLRLREDGRPFERTLRRDERESCGGGCVMGRMSSDDGHILDGVGGVGSAGGGRLDPESVAIAALVRWRLADPTWVPSYGALLDDVRDCVSAEASHRDILRAMMAAVADQPDLAARAETVAAQAHAAITLLLPKAVGSGARVGIAARVLAGLKSGIRFERSARR